jgi:UDP:flavonoid glycosyltransferase YjiC (YdhE family)
MMSAWAFLLCAQAEHSENESPRLPHTRLEILAVALPMSPLHSVVAIGQELCLRGHNVTVASFSDDGLRKVRKYSPACKLSYVSLGTAPLSKAEMDAFAEHEVSRTNSSLAQISVFARRVLAAFVPRMHEPIDRLITQGALSPDFALLSLPVGGLAGVLDKHGVEFAVNIPTNIIPPISADLALWVPPLLYPTSVRNMSTFDRFAVLVMNAALTAARHAASALGLVPAAAADLEPATLSRRLVLVNSIPGLDYPQPLPPLVQYTGPVIALDRLEQFAPDVSAWLDAVPAGKSVVYVSYGTVAVLPPEQVAHMVAALAGDASCTPFCALWALPTSQQAGLPAELPPNLLIRDWVPTQRALAHAKVKLFVSHCGGNSLSESLSMGKPVVGYPQFGDQPLNCLRLADAGAGTCAVQRQSWLRRSDVLHVLSEPAYEQRAQALRRLFMAYGGVARAADLIELGARGDLALMVPPPSKSFAAWVQLNGLDLLALAVVSAHVGACLVASCAVRIWRKRWRRRPVRAGNGGGGKHEKKD